jgi:GABA permease
MRNPVRGEADAFHIAYGGAVLIGASIILGALIDPLVGVALFVGGLLGAFVWETSTKDPDRRRAFAEAASQGRAAAPSTQRRVLIVANRTLQGEELREQVRRRAADGATLRVVAPILTSRAHYIATDVDKELTEARERLAHAIAWAQGEGLKITGKVGDPIAALGAIEDELRLFGPDEVIISTHPPGKSNWLETGIVERLRDELDIPVTHVIVDLEHPRVTTGP